MMLKVKKLHPDAKLPIRAHAGDAGLDLTPVSAVLRYEGEDRVMAFFIF